MSSQKIERKLLLRAELGTARIDNVELRELNFPGGQETGRHLHPCAVIDYIVQGAAIVQIEGEAAHTAAAGAAVYEPANRMIARFDNASASEPLKFIACYLREGQQELIRMMPAGADGAIAAAQKRIGQIEAKALRKLGLPPKD
jgi:quercetin dioxygenase-like cupin family protein